MRKYFSDLSSAVATRKAAETEYFLPLIDKMESANKMDKETNEIKMARIATGLTQQAMSDLLDIPKRTIENWDMGIRNPPSGTKKMILEKLHTIKEQRG